MDSVKRAFDKCRPDIVINTAAYVRVDYCEADADKAFEVNAVGARNVAVACQQLGAKLVHISTDYVFGGEVEVRTTPYTEFDTPIPPNLYGKSKLGGGRAWCGTSATGISSLEAPDYSESPAPAAKAETSWKQCSG